MKINDLKIKDKVKFKMLHDGILREGSIESISVKYFGINDGRNIWNVLYDDIISKLEQIGNGATTIGPVYKEIPIEKEDVKAQPSLYEKITFTTYELNQNIPETKYYCKNCKKYLSGMTGYPMNDYSRLCKECENKEKLISFQAEIDHLNFLGIEQTPIQPGCFPEVSIHLRGSKLRQIIDNLLEKPNKKGTYILEIRIKE